MPERPAFSLAESLAAAQAWWREAGVDYAYSDAPVSWLSELEAVGAAEPVQSASLPAAAPKVEPEIEPVGGDRAGWPRDLAAFAAWWLTEPSLDAGGTHPRIAPRGAPGAPLLLLVPMPEDGDSETLLAGPHGRLMASFLRAAGLAPEAVAVASALPRYATLPDWPRLAALGHGEVVLHLLELLQPQRLIVFGRGILPLLGHVPAQGAPAVSELAIQGRSVPLMSTYAPERLLENARLRAGLWQRWLEWTDGGSA